MTPNNKRRIFLAIVFAIGAFGTAYATSTLLSQFNALYGTAGTVLDTCNTCHTANIPNLNPYGMALQNAGNNFQAIENLDSDGDGFTNIQEIRALTFPGDPNSHPASGGTPDTTPPVVTAFTIPATSASLTVPITSFTATDNIGVTGYMVTQSSTPPVANATGWMTSPPTSFTFLLQGSQTLWAWAKDAAGNVSSGVSATTMITVSGGGGGTDTTAPVITAFSLPATSTSRRVQILSFMATDDVGVTGYLVSQSSRTPKATSRRWSSSPPTSFVFDEDVHGKVTLYAFAKDAAGNVSAAASASTTIKLQGGDDGGGSGDDTGETGDDGGGGTGGGQGDDSATRPSPRPTGEAGVSMSVWVSQWFSVTIQNSAGMQGATNGFLKIQSWNSDASTLQAALFTPNAQGAWASTDLTLQVSGTPLRFLASFEHANEFQFAASVTAMADAAGLQAATLNAIAMTHGAATATGGGQLVTLNGRLVSKSDVPVQILH